MGSASPNHQDAPTPSAGSPLTAETLLTFVQDAVIGTDLQFRITSWNPGAEALYGWPAAEVVGQTVHAVLHTQYRDAEPAQVLQQFQATGAWRGEVLQHHRDGHAITIMASVALVRGPGGDPLGAVSVNRDIGELKAAEARLEALITSVPTGIGYLDTTLRYQLVNPALAALNGRTPAEHVGRTMAEMIPNLAPQFAPVVHQVLTTGEAVRDLELHGGPCSPDGASSDWLISFFPVRGAAGEVAGVSITVTDITASTRATATLRETERKLSTLFELLPVGVSIFDASGSVVAMNPAQEAIFRLQQGGVAREGVLDRPFFRPDGTPRPRAELATERALREHQPALDVESGFVGATGETHWITASAVPVDFSDWRVVAVASDITARVQAEQALEHERQQLAVILHTMHEGIIAARPDGRIVLINPAALAMRGLDPAHPPATLTELVQWTAHQPVDTEGQALPLERLPMSRVLRGERYSGLELCLRSTRDGQELWQSFNGSPVSNADGGVILGIVTGQDITQRKRDEATLREQAALLDDAHVLVRDLDGRIISWNRGAEQLYGWTAAEAIGQITHKLFQTRFPGPFEAFEQQLLRHGVWEGELIHTRRDGTELVVASHQSLLRDRAGRPWRILEVNNDITAQRRAEQLLRERDAQLRLAHDAAQLGTWWRDPATGIIHVDPRAQTYFGLAAAASSAETLQACIHPEDRLIWSEAIRAMMNPAGDGRATVEHRVVHPDGSIRWLAVHARTFFTGEGAVRRVALTSGTVQDITAAKQTEAQLRTSEERFRLLAEQAQDLIYRYRLTPEPGFEYVSPAATAITGYTPEEHYADPQLGFKLIEPEDRQLLAQDNAGEAGSPLVLRWRHKDGTVIWTEQLTRLLRDAAGQPVAIEGIARDITARKQAEEEVRAAHARLQHLSQRLLETQEQERRHIARELHDEVGQALTGLRLSLNLASRLPLEERDGHLAEALRICQELMAMVRALSLDLRPAMLDDMGLLPALLWQLKRHGEQTGIVVDFRQRGLEQRLPITVETVAYRIVQEALTNLARYAGVATASVNVLASAERLRIQVRDAGRGFVLEDVLADHRSSGLAGMQERVSLLGGTLLIETAPGEGTCITVGLPLGEKRR